MAKTNSFLRAILSLIFGFSTSSCAAGVRITNPATQLPSSSFSVSQSSGACISYKANYVNSSGTVVKPSTNKIVSLSFTSGSGQFFGPTDSSCSGPTVASISILKSETSKNFFLKISSPQSAMVHAQTSSGSTSLKTNMGVVVSDGGSITTPPAAPNGLIATALSSSQINLSWTDASSNESGFRIYRATGSGAYALIQTTAANTVNLSNQGLSASTLYQYKIEAFNSAGASAQVGPVGAITLSPPVSTSGLERGLWVWRNSEWVNQLSERSALFNYAVQNQFNVLYVDVESDLNGNTTNLRNFVEAGAAMGLKFRFLLGSQGVVANSRATGFLAATSNLKNQLSAAGQIALQGVQYDVETYGSNSGGDATLVAPMFLAVRAAQQASYSNVIVDFCIPRWFDGKTYNGKKLSEVAQDASDMVTLMDYVDTSARIIADAQTEVSYATLTGKKVNIGVETLCSVGSGETFCQEGRAAMESALGATATHFLNQSGYGGNAVHYYDSLKNLAP